MVTNRQDTPTDWTINLDEYLLGYIHEIDSAHFEARIPHIHPGKGGFSPSIGIFDTFNLAQTALINLKNKQTYEKTI